MAGFHVILLSTYVGPETSSILCIFYLPVLNILNLLDILLVCISGNHALIFQAIDAFFGMERYLIDENMIRYIPVRQREFTSVLRRHSNRAQIEKGECE
jgi:hypothetical protein